MSSEPLPPRWLRARFFWPAYALCVTVFLLFTEPWETWPDAAEETAYISIITDATDFPITA